MSQGLSQMNNKERRAAIERRLRVDAGGLGTLAAKDAQKYLDKKKENDDDKEK